MSGSWWPAARSPRQVLRLRGDDPEAIRAAAEAIATGRVVAFPTDTAYGVGVRPDLAAAVDAVYVLKGRPHSLPLILLAATVEDFAGWAELPELAGALAARWWPGPLTLVVPAGPRTPPNVRGADGTVGVRIPAHSAALRLLEATGPLATTSANRSGEPSPRKADAVEASFPGEDEPAVLIDGGPTLHGADSTVLTLVPAPRILRRGAVSAEDLRPLLPGLGEAPSDDC